MTSQTQTERRPSEDHGDFQPLRRGERGVLHFIEAVCEKVGKGVAFLILGLALMVGYDVIMRFFFDRPTIWGQELSTMLFGTFIILGGAYTGFKKGHVTMDIIYGRFSRRGKAILDIITFFALTLPFLLVLVWYGGSSAWRSLISLERDSTQWGPPLYPFRIMLPLGAFLFLLQACAKLVRDFQTATGSARRRD